MTYLTDRYRHLICIPYSIEALHRMAKNLNIKRWWFHKDHYDIPKRRIKEIEDQCIMIDRRLIVHIIKGGLISLEPEFLTQLLKP